MQILTTLASVMPALIYAAGTGRRGLPSEKIRNEMLAAAGVGYFCKHNATLSGAAGGCQAEIGVASVMKAALLAQAHDFDPQAVAAIALTAKEMNSKYKETSEGGLAVSLVLCQAAAHGNER